MPHFVTNANQQKNDKEGDYDSYRECLSRSTHMVLGNSAARARKSILLE